MKKIISILLSAIMSVALLAGCGKGSSSNLKDTDGDVTLKIAISGAETKESGAVMDEINKKLSDLLPNTKIEMIYGASAEKWPLWMSTQKEIDLVHSGFFTDLESDVRNEYYLELNDLVEENAPDLKKNMEKYWVSYDTGFINGKLYAISNVQFYVKETYVLKVYNQVVPYLDSKALVNEAWSSDKTTAKFYDILSDGIAKAQKAGVDCAGMVNLSTYELAKRGYHFIGGDNSNFCYDNSDSGKIIDFYTTQEFKDYCAFMKKAAASGWVSKDVLTGQWSDHLYVSDGSRYGEDKTTGIIPSTGDASETTAFDLNNPDNDVLTTNIGANGSYWSIPFTSQNPARAMKLLNLLHSEKGKDIVNLLAYGIEGKHYEFTDKENGDIKAFDYIGQPSSSSAYGIANWKVSNMLLGMYVVEPYKHGIIDYANDYYLNKANQAKKHVLYGYNFDLESIRAKFNKIAKNNDEYAESIYCGIVDNSEELLNDLNAKNKSAGYEDVISELQKQADDYIKSNK